MANYVDNGLDAAITSLTSVIAPAVSTEDPLATEQVVLVTDYLRFLRSRLPFLSWQERFDLDHYIDMATRLTTNLGEAPQSAELARALEQAQCARTLSHPQLGVLAETAEVLAAAIADTVDSLPLDQDDVVTSAERDIVACSRVRVDFERSWYEPLAIAVEAEDLPSFTSFFGSE
jgi:hypothetical protein